jgi:hypothetical protein
MGISNQNSELQPAGPTGRVGGYLYVVCRPTCTSPNGAVAEFCLLACPAKAIRAHDRSGLVTNHSPAGGVDDVYMYAESGGGQQRQAATRPWTRQPGSHHPATPRRHPHGRACAFRSLPS